MIKGRFVLDTNVLVSALLFSQGRLSWIRLAWQSDAFRPMANRDTINELIRVLHYPKFKLTEEERLELLDDYLPWCESVEVPASTEVVACRDPSDRPFLQLALVADAEGLVTGDRDLLVLREDLSVPIVSPQEFKSRLAIT